MEQLELENKLNRKSNIFTSRWEHERESRVVKGEIGIYHKDSDALLIPLCIHGWSGRNTRERFSHPGAPSNIHAFHTLAVKVGWLLLLSSSISLSLSLVFFSYFSTPILFKGFWGTLFTNMPFYFSVIHSYLWGTRVGVTVYSFGQGNIGTLRDECFWFFCQKMKCLLYSITKTIQSEKPINNDLVFRLFISFRFITLVGN